MKVLWGLISSAMVSRVGKLLSSDEFEIITPKVLSEDEIRRLVEEADFLVIRRLPSGVKVTKEIINAGKKLKLIQKIGTRVDYIDVEAAKKAGIPVAIMPTISDNSVAEHAILLMLALSKNLFNAHRAVVNAEYLNLGLRPKCTTEWEYAPNWVKLSTNTLYGKVLGLIGMGEIGKEVAKRAVCFGMEVLYYKVHRLSQIEEKKLNVSYRPLDELLRESDFVSLHLPHTKETENLIGHRELSLMKRTAFLINTARGGCVDENALYQALEKNLIAGAGLDVFKEEPVPKDNPLLKLENVILTPHSAGGGRFDLTLEDVCNNILRVARGKKPINVVN